MSSCSSIQRDLDRFLKACIKETLQLEKSHKSVFTLARAKMDLYAFKKLNEVSANTFYEQNEVYTWNGIRTLRVDGFRLVLLNHQSIRDEFGVHKLI